MDVKYLITITKREYSSQFIDFLQKNGCNYILRDFAKGTADKSMMELLGMNDNDKVIIRTMIKEENESNVKDGLKKLGIGSLGTGIALFIKVDGLGGESSKEYLLGKGAIKKAGEDEMELSKYVLIITICDIGNTETVMNTAREAGAKGGTVVKANGTGSQMAKFFGVSISEEKEMIYIVCKREERDGIMKSIMEKCGYDTPSHGVVFSLPVESELGLQAFND